MIKLPHTGWLKIAGPDAERFLQGQITCDIRDIQGNVSRLAAHCNPQGRILFLFRIFHYQNNYYLNLPLLMVPIALLHFKKYSVFFKVTVEDVSNDLQAYGVYGTLCENGFPIPSSHTEGRYIVLGAPPLPLLNELIWKEDDILSGLPMIYPEQSARFLPHDINLPELQGVSFQKGCYTGQEIIARMQHRGRPKYHMITAMNTTYPLEDIVDTCQRDGNPVYSLVIVKREMKDKCG